MYCDILCFAQHQGFEGSIVAENFSSSDPSSNNPMMHGGLDNGGGLISFHRVSENSFCPCFFPSTVTVQRAKHSGPNCRMKKDWFTIVCCDIPWRFAFYSQKVYLLNMKSLLPSCAHLWKKLKPRKDQSVLVVSF